MGLGHLPQPKEAYAYEKIHDSYVSPDHQWIVETNLHFELQWLIAGNLDPLPEKLYPKMDTIEFWWNLQCNLIEHAFPEIEWPNLNCDSYSKRLMTLDYDRVYDRVCEILCPVVMRKKDITRPYEDRWGLSIHFPHEWDLENLNDGTVEIYNYQYYEKSVRTTYIKGEERETRFEDSLEKLRKTLDILTRCIIKSNQKNRGLELVGLESGWSSLAKIWIEIAKKIAKQGQLNHE